jgi:hypothetical protein
MGWNRAALHDHVARLQRAGLVRRVAMTRGEGSLIVVTRDGTRMIGDGGEGVPRSIAPTSWAHTVACAWTAAWFEVRARAWVSSREIARDDRWRGRVVYQDGSGRTQRVRHRPDVGTFVGHGRRPVAVEVELQRKAPARLRGILGMYAARTTHGDDGGGGGLAGVVYITGSDSVTNAVRAGALAVGLGEHPAGRLRLLELDGVIAQTRAVAHESRTARRSAAGVEAVG